MSQVTLAANEEQRRLSNETRRQSEVTLVPVSEAPASQSIHPNYPLSRRNQVDGFRFTAMLFAFITIMLQVTIVYVHEPSRADLGSFQGLDHVGFPLYTFAFFFNVSMLGMQMYVRHYHAKGDLSTKGFFLPLGFVLILDIAIALGCGGWGGFMAHYGLHGKFPIFTFYAVVMFLTGFTTIKLVYNDCRYIHRDRKEARRKSNTENNSIYLQDMVR